MLLYGLDDLALIESTCFLYPKNLKLSFCLFRIFGGNTRDGLLGWSAYESTDIGIGLGGSLTGSIGIQDFSSQYKPAWIYGGLGIGAYIGGGFTGGLSYSWPIVPGQFK